MYKTHSSGEKIRLFALLFLPILIYQLANYSASFIDTMMTGRYATVDLAGVSMATSLWNPFFTFLTGIVSALVPIVGQHLGRGDEKSVSREFHQFTYMSIGLSLFFWILVQLGADHVLALLGLEESVYQVASNYLSWLSLGIFPLFLFSVCRSLFDALGLTRLSMVLMLLLVPLNSFFNYVLIFGKMGLPEMGGAGAGLGTALAYWFVLMLVVAILMLHPKVKAYRLWELSSIDVKDMSSGFRLGLPIGGAIFAEVAIFAVVGLLMAKYSTALIASHQAAMNFASLMYAFPVSIATALPIAVSYEVGARRYEEARQYARIGRLLAFGFVSITLIFLFLFRYKVAALYGTDPSFIERTGIFLTYSLFFQLADAFTAPVQGILRGYKDTRLPFLLGVIAYWGISLPSAFLLEWLTPLGPYSYWVGLILGIFSSGLLLSKRLTTIQRRFDGLKK
ncbi:MATE family efflux transporter [Streptococcus moroccensis]|uniref:Probable multidrug resistance protein NorM n=1 Tax=Streptococcus moroccensis TaxID=1451356 RepID=A0ABT9YUF7_9STRE|nr:MATE family efflux transporter [Streptococcus moroccensis]MDQ0223628.1 MATE family multidrug resistance protein [Streptococcus moroccensis]